MSRTFSLLVCAVLFSAARIAQRPKTGATPAQAATHSPVAKDPYGAEPVVMEQLDTAYRYNADGTGSKLDSVVVRMQNEAALRSFMVLSVPYSASTRRVEFISVKVRKGNGTVIDTPVNEPQDQVSPVAQAAPLYSDFHVALLPVRGLAVGDRLEYQVRTVFTAAEAKDQFWGAESFGHGRVILERGIELRVPAGTYVQVIAPKNPAKVTEEAGERVYRWTGSQTRSTVRQPAGEASGSQPGDESPLEDPTPPVAWTTFHTWAEVGNWLRSETAGSTTPTAAVKAKADQIVFGLGSPRARIDALYGFVSREIRSINVPLSQGSWPTHPASDVLSNQFGDSKDKSALLTALLRAEGIQAALALVPANREVNEAVPAPLWFSQGATEVTDPGHGELWLDTLPEIAPPGALDASLRDEMALVVPATGEAQLRRTPADLPFAASTRFEATGTLSEAGLLKAHVDLVLRGDEEMRLRQALRSSGPAQWDRVAQAFAQEAELRGEATNTVASDAEDSAKPLHLNFDLGATAYGDWDNFRIVPVEPALALPFATRKTSPEREIDLGGKRTETAVSRLTLPAGLGADLPPAVHIHTGFADLDKVYTLQPSGAGAVLVTERTLDIKQGRLPAARWPEYRKFLDDMGESEPWMQLTSARASGSHHAPAAGENVPKAGELVSSAEQALDRRDWAGAAAKLDQAKALSARQPFLWSSYAAIAQATGKPEEAIADNRRELEAHPEEASVSHRLAGELAGTGRTAEAMDVLKAALALNPRDERTVMLLGDLQAAKDLSAAEKTLRTGLALAPDNHQLKLALGRVLLREGKRDEGGAMLASVATDSQDPGELNDAAFDLADAGVNLRLAESASRRSVQMLNVASARGEGRGQRDAELQQTMRLIASWDTYGCVLFKEGLTSEAEPWLRAAWADGFGGDSGRHLALLLQKQGKAQEASAVLRLAAQGDSERERADGEGAVPRAQRAASAEARGGRAERTVSVPRPGGGPAGEAVFQLEYAFGAPIGAYFVSGSDALAGMGTALPRVNTRTVLPTGSPAHIFRRGVLRCEAGGSCSLEMLPIRTALAQ